MFGCIESSWQEQLRGLTGQWVVCTLAEKLLQLRRDYVKINDTSTDATEFSPCVPECL